MRERPIELDEQVKGSQTIGMRIGFIGVGLTLLSMAHVGCRSTNGGQSGDEGPLHFQGPGGLATPPETPTTALCSHGVSYANERVISYVCTSKDERYLSGELAWSVGDPTPAGAYECRCPYEAREVSEVPDADSCEDALIVACGVDLDGPKPCSVPDTLEGACWPERGAPGTWSCRCRPDEPLKTAQHADCRSAGVLVCPPTCSDAGQCETTSSDGG